MKRLTSKFTLADPRSRTLSIYRRFTRRHPQTPKVPLALVLVLMSWLSSLASSYYNHTIIAQTGQIGRAHV